MAIQPSRIQCPTCNTVNDASLLDSGCRGCGGSLTADSTAILARAREIADEQGSTSGAWEAARAELHPKLLASRPELDPSLEQRVKNRMRTSGVSWQTAWKLESPESDRDAKRLKRIESFRKLATIAGITMAILLALIMLIAYSVRDADDVTAGGAGMVAGLFVFPLLGAWVATLVGLTGIAVTPGTTRQRLVSAALALFLLAPLVWLVWLTLTIATAP